MLPCVPTIAGLGVTLRYSKPSAPPKLAAYAVRCTVGVSSATWFSPVCSCEDMQLSSLSLSLSRLTGNRILQAAAKGIYLYTYTYIYIYI